MTYTDLISLVVTLRPNKGIEPEKALPSWWGRSVHGLLYKTISAADPAYAETLHASDDKRPFTVSSLIGRFPGRSLDPTEPYFIRFTGLNEPVARILIEGTQPGRVLAPGSSVELDDIPFQIQTAVFEGHPQAGCTTYAELASQTLIAADPSTNAISLRFLSPTNFSSKGHLSTNGQNIPFPLPDFVFGSLLDRWNAFSTVAFPAELRRYAAECIHLNRFDILSRSVTVAGGIQLGFIGRVTFKTHHYDRYWMSLIHTLARYAFYAGIGAKTTMGLGQSQAEAEKSSDKE